MVIFEAYMGKSYACSPKAIYEEMLNDEKYKDYIFVWAFKEPKEQEEKYTKKCIYCNEGIDTLKHAIIIKYGSRDYYKYYSTAKYWVSNSRIPEQIIKKPNQVYLQCWHGTPLKRLGHDIIGETQNALNTDKEMAEKYDIDTKKYTYMISPSRFATEKFTTAFNLKALHAYDILLEVGYPRNDYLYNYKKKDLNIIKKKLKLPLNKKVILYAPTWRDNQHESGLGYVYKTEVDFDYLKDKIKDDYIILFRPHYFVANKFAFEKYNGFIYDVSDVDDVNDLYVISDILITDYSSVFFDYANLNRPMIFFMYDLEFYQYKLRGFYFDLDELPGDIVKTEEEIVNILNNLDDYNEKHRERYKLFNNKFTYLDDGNASKRVIETVFK